MCASGLGGVSAGLFLDKPDDDMCLPQSDPVYESVATSSLTAEDALAPVLGDASGLCHLECYAGLRGYPGCVHDEVPCEDALAPALGDSGGLCHPECYAGLGGYQVCVHDEVPHKVDVVTFAGVNVPVSEILHTVPPSPPPGVAHF